MQLWNDYEGRTIAEVYPLGQLLRPEGRSAFFSTSNGTGTPSVIRIIEAHFDESEILERWKVISEMGQPNLVTMRKFGEAELDGTPLVYAVMEPTELSLADVLQNRTLTPDETRELATSLVDALQALHARGFIHEHILPENIYAVGETVKLRSDCVREAGAGLDENSPEIAERQSRDVHDLVVVLLQALTGHRELKGSATLLPTPFDGIIRNGLAGNWNLDKMASALKPTGTALTLSRPPTPSPTQPPKPVTPAITAAIKPAPTPVTPPKPAPTPQPVATTRPEPKPTAPEPDIKPDEPILPKRTAPVAIAPNVRDRIVKPIASDPRRTRKLIVYAVGALLLLLLCWYFLHSQKDEAHPISTLATPPNHQPAQQPTPAVKRSAILKPAAARVPTAVAAATALPPSTPLPVSTTSGRTQWRVVAYTYNHEDQAQQKASTLSHKASGLNPQVFSPSGHAPYLVSLGGPMTREDAVALRQKAINEGLPHDTYIQNYSH
jgi:eukaryotic-like serine/threonine-protein kinase